MLQIKQKNAGSHAEWLVKPRYTFGSGADNNYMVHGEGVRGVQAGLEIVGDQAILLNLAGGKCVTLNGNILKDRENLKHGDEFSVGDAMYIIEDPKALRMARKPEPITCVGWTLKGSNTAMSNKIIPLEGSKIIGRAHECDICLNVVHLSRQHARISLDGNQLSIEDLNSSNGTFVNGERITSKILNHGDDIAFDTLHFRVFGPEQKPSSTSNPRQSSNTQIRSASAQATPKPARRQNSQAAVINPFPRIDNPLLSDEDAARASQIKKATGSIGLLLLIALLATALLHFTKSLT